MGKPTRPEKLAVKLFRSIAISYVLTFALIAHAEYETHAYNFKNGNKLEFQIDRNGTDNDRILFYEAGKSEPEVLKDHVKLVQVNLNEESAQKKSSWLAKVKPNSVLSKEDPARRLGHTWFKTKDLKSGAFVVDQNGAVGLLPFEYSDLATATVTDGSEKYLIASLNSRSNGRRDPSTYIVRSKDNELAKASDVRRLLDQGHATLKNGILTIPEVPEKFDLRSFRTATVQETVHAASPQNSRPSAPVHSNTNTSTNRPFVELEGNAKLVYDLNSKPYQVLFEKSGAAPKMIYQGPLDQIRISDLNGASIPSGVRMKIAAVPTKATFFNTATHKSVLVLNSGDVYYFPEKDGSLIQEANLAELANGRDKLISIEYSNGQAKTLFYNGKTVFDINDEYHGGRWKEEALSPGERNFVWGDKAVKFRSGHVINFNELTAITDANQALARKPQVGALVDQAAAGTAGHSSDPFALDEAAKRIKGKVIEQDHVIDAYMDVWERTGKPSARKKHGVVAVLGTTGSGKTFSAEQFAIEVLGDRQRLLEIDASQFSDKGKLWALTGGSASHQGYGETKGMLPDFLRGRGKGESVIVINEIEKACPEFFTALMEMMDKGRLQAGDGKIDELGHSLIIFTSNKAANQIYPRGAGNALSRKEIEARKEKLDSETLKKYFIELDPHTGFDEKKRMPPEIANRITHFVAAFPPSREGALKVVHDELVVLLENAKADDGLAIEFDPHALEKFVESRYIPEDGIRPLANELDDLVHKVAKVVKKSMPHSPDGVVKVEYSPASDDAHAFFAIHSGGETQTLKAPKPPTFVENPLTDPSANHKIENIERDIKKTVFGQDHAVALVSRAVRAKALNTLTKKPAAAVLLGPTGTGKTEIGKAIATEVFGDSKRLLRLDMGEVKSDGHFNNMFGSQKGFKGSDSLAPFEEFLLKYPEGGVIMFDEIGNMGGDGANQTPKKDLLKKFYPMLDEGEWRSPQGKVYDLRKYVILFSTNEGEELFQKLPSDDLRLAEWERSKGKDSVREVLKKHGWPEALVARFQGDTAMMKPLTESEREFVAKKLFSTTLNQLSMQHKLKNYEVEPDFFKKAGTTFFSHAEGARKIGGVSEKPLTDLIGKVLLQNRENKDLKNSTLRISLSDNYIGVHSYEGAEPPKREVKLIATLHAPNGEKKVYEADVTDDAAVKRLHNEVELEETAIHEAGHGIANIREKTGEAWDFVTLHGEGDYGGYARYRKVAPKGTLTRDEVIARIARALAGREAEKLIGVPQNTGWSSDLKNARELVKNAITEYGLSLQPFKANSGASADDEIESLLEEGRRLAEKRLRENWPAVRTFADELKSKGKMSSGEIEGLLKKTSTPEFHAEFAKKHPNDPVIHPSSKAQTRSNCIYDTIISDFSRLLDH